MVYKFWGKVFENLLDERNTIIKSQFSYPTRSNVENIARQRGSFHHLSNLSNCYRTGIVVLFNFHQDDSPWTLIIIWELFLSHHLHLHIFHPGWIDWLIHNDTTLFKMFCFFFRLKNSLKGDNLFEHLHTIDTRLDQSWIFTYASHLFESPFPG